MSENGNQAVAEAAAKLNAAQAAVKPNRKQRRTAAAQAKAEVPGVPAMFSREWLEASIQAQAQEMQKFYDLWQQSQGALTIMQQQLNLVIQAEQKAKADDTSTD